MQLEASVRFLRIEAANETFLNYQQANRSVFPVPDFTPASAWNTNQRWVQKDSLSILNRWDRAYFQINADPLQVLIGKQVIPLGVGQIFNAVSQMQRYPLIFIDPEFPKTEDAVSVIYSGAWQWEARYLPKAPGQREDNFHLRTKGSLLDIDVGLIAGRSDDKTFAGVEAAGNWGESLLRGELSGYRYRNRTYGQALLGWDHVFSATWSTKFEVFYNGFGEISGQTLGVFPHRSTPFRGTWYVGNFTTWEIHPLLKAHLLSVCNLQDSSALFHAYLNYSLSNSVDLLGGRFFNLGAGKEEFGGQIPLSPQFGLGQPDISYLALRWYF